MTYRLYIGNNCHDCDKVVEEINSLKTPVEILNVDGGKKPPFDIFIFPALLDENNDLLAYGLDIPDLLREQQKGSLKYWWRKLWS